MRAYGGFGEGRRKRYHFVPYMDLPDGWFTKDGNSYCSEPLADGAAMSHHIKGVPQAQERQEVIHINTDWRGRAKPGPWCGRYYDHASPGLAEPEANDDRGRIPLPRRVTSNAAPLDARWYGTIQLMAC